MRSANCGIIGTDDGDGSNAVEYRADVTVRARRFVTCMRRTSADLPVDLPAPPPASPARPPERQRGPVRTVTFPASASASIALGPMADVAASLLTGLNGKK